MRQIRSGVFETNSSSTHSLTMCLESEYDKWTSGEMLLFTGSGFGFADDNQPEKDCFYTREEAVGFVALGEYCPVDIDWNNEEEVNDLLDENEFKTYDRYNDEYLEWFESTYITPSGEAVVAFGQFGYDG